MSDDSLAHEIANRALQMAEDNKEDHKEHEEVCGRRYAKLDGDIEKLSNRMLTMHAENQELMWSVAKAAIYSLASMVTLMGAGIVGWIVTQVSK